MPNALLLCSMCIMLNTLLVLLLAEPAKPDAVALDQEEDEFAGME